MTFDPSTGKWDLVVTNRDTLQAGLSLFAGYRATEYHRFPSLHSAKSWLEMDVQQNRTKIMVLLTKDELRVHMPECYYRDWLNSKPYYYGCYTQQNPRYWIGKLAVYDLRVYIPHFPIYKDKCGNDFCLIGSGTNGLYRALSTEYINTDSEVGAP